MPALDLSTFRWLSAFLQRRERMKSGRRFVKVTIPMEGTTKVYEMCACPPSWSVHETVVDWANDVCTFWGARRGPVTFDLMGRELTGA